MTKAIFVLETMPKSCAECNYIIYGDNKNKVKGRCILNDKYIEHYNDIDTMRADICPLKPMPRERLPFNADDLFALGWNVCIDEILGGKSE